MKAVQLKSVRSEALILKGNVSCKFQFQKFNIVFMTIIWSDYRHHWLKWNNKNRKIKKWFMKARFEWYFIKKAKCIMMV